MAAGRFISGTGAQNKEKMIDWMMNYLEVESRGTSQPWWREREGERGRETKETSRSKRVQLPFIAPSPLVEDGNSSKNLPLVVLMHVTANLPK